MSIAFGSSAALFGAAIALFPMSPRVTCLLTLGGILAAALGLLTIDWTRGQNSFWELLFACASIGCGLNGARNLFLHPVRWVHRLVIYTGYGAVFASMAASCVWLSAHAASFTLVFAVFAGIYIAGSASIFAAKTLTLRITARTMPEYHASLLTGGQTGNGYW